MSPKAGPPYFYNYEDMDDKELLEDEDLKRPNPEVELEIHIEPDATKAH